MKMQLAAATAAIALFAGHSAMATDASFDPVLSSSNWNQSTTSNPQLPLQSRAGAPTSGERTGDPGTGMPPHSPGLAPTSYDPPPSSGPVYYTQPTYYVPAQPVYYSQPVVVTQPVVVSQPVATGGTSIGGLVGAEVTDMYGMRVGQVTDIQIMPDRTPYAIVGLGSWPGQVERTIALPLNRMHHSTGGRLAYAATADQIRAVPTY